MGIMSNTVSIYQYKVIGDAPKNDFYSWVQNCLIENRFVPIDETPDPESIGWVNLHDPMDYEFDNENIFRREQYLTFSLRRDQRKVPAAVVKNLVAQECEKWLSERPKLTRVPLQRKAEIRDNINAALLSKVLPVPSTCDVVWNTQTNVVSIGSISTRVLDLVEDEFIKTFEGLSLVPVHPMSRAESVLGEEHQRALERVNLAGSRDVILQIKKNKWLGWDFFLWLMFQTSNASSEYKVNQDGHAEKDNHFVSYLYDKFVLVGEHEDGLRKSSITGPQKDFSEAKRAILDGKNITEAVLYFEKDAQKWKMTLKGDVFAFGSYTCPPVKIEKDEITDPEQERQAVFYERMSLMETGLQLFDSLFATFLSERVLGKWPDKLKQINAWLNK